MTALLVAAGGALGAALRYCVSARLDGDVPFGTLAVNVAGSFVLGLLVGLPVGDRGYALLGLGFCGGLTTYSAFAVQTVGLGRRGPAYAAATIGLSVAAAALGYGLGHAIAQA